jgi:PDZ domain-containing secreted protein
MTHALRNMLKIEIVKDESTGNYRLITVEVRALVNEDELQFLINKVEDAYQFVNQPAKERAAP